MQVIKLNDEIYSDFFVLTESEYNAIGNDYKGRKLLDNSVRCAFLPGRGTILYFENIHFLIIEDHAPVRDFAIFRDHRVIGHCNITHKAADMANMANNAVFHFENMAV